jgi:hypothetical protein
MEAVQIESCITLSRVAGGDAIVALTGAKTNTYFNSGVTAIPFGRFVEKDGTGSALTYGGFCVDKCNGTRAWTAGASTVLSLQTAIFDLWEDTTPYMHRHAITGLATGGIVSYCTTTAEDWSEDTYIYILCKTSVAFTVSGHLTFCHDEHAAIASPEATALPEMAINTWYFHRVALAGATSARNAVLSYGFKQVSGGAAYTGNVDVQYIGRGNCAYGTLGVGVDDQMSIHSNHPSEEYEEGDDITIINAGAVNARLCKGVTAVAGQPLYVVPGNGTLHTTAIVDGNRTITALEDQTTSMGQLAVRI